MQLHREEDRIHAAGARLVFVGNGDAHYIEGFRKKTRYHGPLYTDPELTAYRALDLKRSALSTVGWRAIRSGLRALKAGARQTRTRGDAWQLGGVFVIDAGGEIAWSHRSDHAGDHPAVDDIVAAVQRAATA